MIEVVITKYVYCLLDVDIFSSILFQQDDDIDLISRVATSEQANEMLDKFQLALPSALSYSSIASSPTTSSRTLEEHTTEEQIRLTSLALAAYRELLHDCRSPLEREQEAARQAKLKAEKEKAEKEHAKRAAVKARKVWTREELSALAKAAAKFPPGTQKYVIPMPPPLIVMSTFALHLIKL